MAEAHGGRVSLPVLTELDIQYIQGVSAFIFSDHRLYLTEQFDEPALSLGSDKITPVAVADLLSDEPARAAVQVSSSVVSSSVGEV